LTHLPLQSASRRVKGQSQTLVQQPFVVRQYNESMGGVDLFDRLLSSYRPGIRGKKWWWALFIHAVNVTVVAAGMASSLTVSHLTFRRDIARTLVKTPLDVERTVMAKDHRSNPPDAVRYDGTNHFAGKVKEGRCRVCSKNTTFSCMRSLRCDVRLHHEHGAVCWDMYHMKRLPQEFQTDDRNRTVLPIRVTEPFCQYAGNVPEMEHT